MGTFYHTKLKIKLSWYERASLFEYWHLITVVSDLLIFPGSVIKIVLDLHYPCSSVSVHLDLGGECRGPFYLCVNDLLLGPSAWVLKGISRA